MAHREVHYPIAIHFQPATRDLGHAPDDFPLTRWLAERVVSLPIYAELTREQRRTVIDGVRSFYGR